MEKPLKRWSEKCPSDPELGQEIVQVGLVRLKRGGVGGEYIFIALILAN